MIVATIEAARLSNDRWLLVLGGAVLLVVMIEGLVWVGRRVRAERRADERAADARLAREANRRRYR